MPHPLIAAAVLVFAQERPAADIAWSFQAASEVKYLRQCDAAELLLTTKTSLVALSAATGVRIWELNGLPSFDRGLYVPCDGKTGLSYRQDKIVAFDLASGQHLWDGAALPPFLEIRDFVPLDRLDLLLLFLRTQASDRSLSAFRLSTGERLWQRDDLLVQGPTFAVNGDVSGLADYQAFVLSGDTSLFLYVSPDGPIRLDLRTGATTWKAQALAGTPVPGWGDYAAMRLVDSTLVIPRDKGFVGVDARSGQVRWQNDTLLPRRATLLTAVPAGILVRAGTDYVNVLDPATGTSRWSRPITLRIDGAGPYIFRTNGAAFAIVENRCFFVSRDRFMVADLATGDTTGFEKLRFKDREWASRVVRAGDGFVVISRQNLFRVEVGGALRYQRFYNAPGASFFQQMAGVFGRYGNAAVADQYAYFVTNAPDSAGRKGNSLVRVALADGSEAGRVWLREKAPAYWPDSPREQVLLLADDRTLVAVRLPPRR